MVLLRGGVRCGIGLELAGGSDDIGFWNGDAHIVIAELTVELTLVEIGNGVPAVLVVYRGLGIPLCDLVGAAGMTFEKGSASAVADRLLHHGQVFYLRGPSWRTKDHPAAPPLTEEAAG